MAVVRPYLISFKDYKGKLKDQFILIESTKSRKKEWILRFSDSWDEGYTTLFNAEQDFKDFMDKFTIKDPSPFSNTTWHSELTKYSDNTFFWNCMNYAFVLAADNLMINYDVESQYKTSFDPAAPDELHLADPKYLHPNYHYDYVQQFKDHYKKHVKKIISNF